MKTLSHNPCGCQYTPCIHMSFTTSSKPLGRNKLSHALLADIMHTFHSLTEESDWNLSTPHNDSYIQQSKCNHSFKNKNNRELRNNINSTIHSYRYKPIHTFGTIYLCYIHPTELVYIHTLFFTTP